MRDDEIEEFLVWQKELTDVDLIRAFRALKLIDRIRFELATREDGYGERIEAYLESF